MNAHKGIILFRILFILSAVAIPLNHSTYIKPYTQNEARAVIQNISNEKQVPLSEETIDRLTKQFTSETSYYINRFLLFVLFFLYLSCGIPMLLNKKYLFPMIILLFSLRFFHTIFKVWMYYGGYRIGSMMLENIKYPLPPINNDLVNLLSKCCVSALISFWGIYYFTRPKIKEHLQ